MSRLRRIILTAAIAAGVTLAMPGMAAAADSTHGNDRDPAPAADSSQGNDRDPAPAADLCSPAVYGTCSDGAGHVVVPHVPVDVHSTSGG